MRIKAEAEAFRRVPLFAQCDRGHLQVIAFAAGRVEFVRGEAIIGQGQIGECAYLVLSGRAAIELSENGRTRGLGTVEPGAFIGELGMIAGLPYAVSVIVVEPVSAARINRDLFMRVVQEFPEFGAHVQAVLARKLDGSVGELRTVKEAFDRAKGFSRR